MSKQTAVIWFNQQLVERQNGNEDRRSWSEILREALQMEREQIIDAYTECWSNDGGNPFHKVKEGEQFYNERYGGQDEEML